MTTIKRTVLNKELKKLVKIVGGSHSTLPITKGILIEYKSNELKMSATDTITSLISKCECQTDLTTDESFVIDARLFSDIITKISGSEITLKYKDDVLNITSEKSKFKIKSMGKKEDFPNIDKLIVDKKSITIQSDILVELVNKTVKFTSDDDTRPTLQGVNVVFSKDKIVGVSLDGFRLAYYEKQIVNEYEVEMIVNSTALINIARAAEGESIILHFNDNNKMLEFNLGNTSVFTSTIDGQFFNFKDMLKPNDCKTSVTINSKDFKEAVDRASIIAKAANTANPIVISMVDKNLIINTHNEMGKVVETVEVGSIEGEDVNYKIAFNSKYILDGLNSISSTDIEFKLNSSLQPAYLVDKENGYIYLALPIRVAEEEETEIEEKAS
jgi:DNA polymerase-3 subunit beta